MCGFVAGAVGKNDKKAIGLHWQNIARASRFFEHFLGVSWKQRPLRPHKTPHRMTLNLID